MTTDPWQAAGDDFTAGFLSGRLDALNNPDPDLIERLAEQRAYELIHERSIEMLGLARREAARKGSAWAALLEDQAAQPWEESA